MYIQEVNKPEERNDITHHILWMLTIKSYKIIIFHSRCNLDSGYTIVVLSPLPGLSEVNSSGDWGRRINLVVKLFCWSTMWQTKMHKYRLWHKMFAFAHPYLSHLLQPSVMLSSSFEQPWSILIFSLRSQQVCQLLIHSYKTVDHCILEWPALFIIRN